MPGTAARTDVAGVVHAALTLGTVGAVVAFALTNPKDVAVAAALGGGKVWETKELAEVS